jgi:hypothetical protein
MPGPAPARTPAKQSRAAPAGRSKPPRECTPGKRSYQSRQKCEASRGETAEKEGHQPVETSTKDSRRPSDQGKQAKKWPPYDEGARIISYNVNEGERPSGIKIRFKIRIVSGREAAALDRQQADAIKKYLRWVRQYRQSRNSAPEDTPTGPPEQRPSG